MRKATKQSLLVAVMLCATTVAQSQEQKGSDWYFGLTEGVHIGSMRFSDVSSDAYDKKKSLVSPVISVFAQGEFGRERQFAIQIGRAHV